jgi:hypothetical protein
LRIDLAEEPVVAVAVDRCFHEVPVANEILYSETHREYFPIMADIVALFRYWRMDQPSGVEAKRSG